MVSKMVDDRKTVALMVLAFLFVVPLAWAADPPPKGDERRAIGAMEEADEGWESQRPGPGPKPRMGPGRVGRPGGPEVGGPWFELSPDERAELRQFVREHFPEIAEELEALREQSPERFERRLRRIAPDMLRLMDTMQIDPRRGILMVQERRLDMRIRQRVRQYRLTENVETRTEIRGQVRLLLGEQFDLRRQRRELEIRQLENRLGELRQHLANSNAKRDQIIEDQLDEFLEMPHPLGPPMEGRLPVGQPDEPPPRDR
jgi:hypothetical protein